SVAQLMRFAGLKQKRVAGTDLSYTIFVANVAPARHDKIELRFRRVRMIGAKCFTLRDPHQREIKWMTLRQIERFRLAPQRDRNVLHHPVKLPLWRFSLLLGNIFDIHLAHRNASSVPSRTPNER